MDVKTAATDQLPLHLLHILQHSLGVDSYGRGQRYRNHFVAGASNLPHCLDLVERGLMREQECTIPLCGPLFVVTREGERAVDQQSPAPPKLTQSQRRYQRFLEADSHLSFGEWLRQGRDEREGE